jgi:hypothetical protein
LVDFRPFDERERERERESEREKGRDDGGGGGERYCITSSLVTLNFDIFTTEVSKRSNTRGKKTG